MTSLERSSPSEREMLRWAVARERLVAYLQAASLPTDAAGATARDLIERLAEQHAPETADDATLLALAETRRLLAESPQNVDRLRGSLLPRTTPLPIRRQSLAPALRWRKGKWLPRPMLLAPLDGSDSQRHRPASQPEARLDLAGRRRRATFIALGLATTAWCVATFAQILAVNGLSALDLAHTIVFTILVLWLSQSFWTLAGGFGLQLGSLFAREAPAPARAPVDPTNRVALLMPIYNEDTERVFAGLATMWRDLRAADPGDTRIDLFILSDTTDPDVWLGEVEAWRRLRAEVGDRDRIFYRRRDRNVGRKAGNIEDFIRRFGGDYVYMLILDADSIMTGRSMLELVRRMDDHPSVGLIQAPPKLVRGKTLFARALQYAGELYGPLAAAGTAFWARGEGNYWGHNAIIRIRPFSELCGLPQLPGRAPLGGQILSHDFVEAALMRRGGWQVWIAHDLAGSYEEPPPTIEDFAVRDRRWCQGNLQHIQILFARHLHWVSRMHLGIGIMSYLTSPLWLIFLVLSAAQAWEITHTRPLYFLAGWPFPMLPVSVEAEATLLLFMTLGLLFIPKVLGLTLAMLDGPRRRALGGAFRIVAGALLETVFSALIAPVMMLLHTRFVVSILSGAAIDWTPQRRAAGQSRFLATLRTFMWPTLIGIAAACAAWVATPPLFVWLSPVWAGLALSSVLAMAGASEGIGWALERWGLLLVREERDAPAVLSEMDKAEALLAQERAVEPPLSPFVRAVLEPQGNALHVQLCRAFGTADPPAGDERWLLERKALFVGPPSLDRRERRLLLESPEMMERLHLMAWLHWPSYLPGVLGALRLTARDAVTLELPERPVPPADNLVRAAA